MFAYFIEAPFVCKSISQLPYWFFHNVVSVILTELCLCTVEDLIGSRQYQANFEQRALGTSGKGSQATIVC